MSFKIRPSDLADLCKWDADLPVRRRRGGRRPVFDLLPILNLFRSRGWNIRWDCLAARSVRARSNNDPGWITDVGVGGSLRCVTARPLS